MGKRSRILFAKPSAIRVWLAISLPFHWFNPFMILSNMANQEPGVSELMPYTAQVVDDLCIVRSMYTEAINHEPAVMFMQTGSQISGRPSIGSWLSYGLGSDNENLPNFVVLISKGGGAQPLNAQVLGQWLFTLSSSGLTVSRWKKIPCYT